MRTRRRSASPPRGAVGSTTRMVARPRAGSRSSCAGPCGSRSWERSAGPYSRIRGFPRLRHAYSVPPGRPPSTRPVRGGLALRTCHRLRRSQRPRRYQPRPARDCRQGLIRRRWRRALSRPRSRSEGIERNPASPQPRQEEKRFAESHYNATAQQRRPASWRSASRVTAVSYSLSRCPSARSRPDRSVGRLPSHTWHDPGT